MDAYGSSASCTTSWNSQIVLTEVAVPTPSRGRPQSAVRRAERRALEASVCAGVQCQLTACLCGERFAGHIVCILFYFFGDPGSRLVLVVVIYWILQCRLSLFFPPRLTTNRGPQNTTHSSC
ncbi:hypothetical protein MHYP_G00329430 [Metynnis hypsauchen]